MQMISTFDSFVKISNCRAFSSFNEQAFHCSILILFVISTTWLVLCLSGVEFVLLFIVGVKCSVILCCFNCGPFPGGGILYILSLASSDRGLTQDLCFVIERIVLWVWKESIKKSKSTIFLLIIKVDNFGAFCENMTIVVTWGAIVLFFSRAAFCWMRFTAVTASNIAAAILRFAVCCFTNSA